MDNFRDRTYSRYRFRGMYIVCLFLTVASSGVWLVFARSRQAVARRKRHLANLRSRLGVEK